MSKSLLVTRPDYDITTKYLYYWTTSIIIFAKNKLIPTFDLTRNKANKTNVDSYIKRHQPKLLFMNGHGSATTITGQNSITLVDINDNFKYFANLILYARSCRSAITLGQKMVDQGLSAYIGYVSDFIFFHDDQYHNQILKDPYAKIFLAPSNLIITTLLKGKTVGEAHTRSLKLMRKYLRTLLASSTTAEQRGIAPFLWSNINSQVVIGNNLSTI